MSNETLRNRLARLLDRALEVRADATGTTKVIAAGFADGLAAAIEEVDRIAAPAPNGDKWAVLIGNPLLGVSVHGPFESWDNANAWGDRHAPRQEFWIAPLVNHPVQAGPTLAVDNDNDEGLH
jgi:hypothetical protein